ncbi:glycosyltransferase [Tistrella mobilis]|uniref:glycosyltransferase n=1 Tax=Tistrella mobilis TaxID=171437 RepID=UPI0035578F72
MLSTLSTRDPVSADPLISVVMPVRDEAAAILPLIAEIHRAFTMPDILAGGYEIIAVDDGSSDGSDRLLAAAALADPRLVAIAHDRGRGQSAAMTTGFRAARGRVIATLDADGQNDPADLARLIRRWMIEAGGPARGVMVAGHRRGRADGAWRKLVSRVANGIRSRVLQDGTPDSGCGLRVIARDDLLALPLFDHAHRFMPSLVTAAGGRVVSVEVTDRRRRGGRSKYRTLTRALQGIVDLAGVAWLQHRLRPLDPIGRALTMPALTMPALAMPVPGLSAGATGFAPRKPSAAADPATSRAAISSGDAAA